MARVPVRFASVLYDRFLALYTGEVKVEGVDLEFVPFFSPRGAFDRMSGGLEFDVAEFSLSEFVSQFGAGPCPFVAIPVFPSRAFRHGMIGIHTAAGIAHPRDLAGKRIGVPLYTMTAAVWIRGMLQDEYGVDLSQVRWTQGAFNSAGRHGDPHVLPLLKPADIRDNDSGRSIGELLAAGELDATLGPSLPEVVRKHPLLRRLFPDFKSVEQDYFRRTGIFPIMHVLVIRRELHERHGFLAPALYRACTEAKQLALRKLRLLGAPQVMLPWLPADMDEIDAFFGGDPYPYGVDANRAALETFARYAQEQALVARRMAAEELFVQVE